MAVALARRKRARLDAKRNSARQHAHTLREWSARTTSIPKMAFYAASTFMLGEVTVPKCFYQAKVFHQLNPRNGKERSGQGSRFQRDFSWRTEKWGHASVGHKSSESRWGSRLCGRGVACVDEEDSDCRSSNRKNGPQLNKRSRKSMDRRERDGSGRRGRRRHWPPRVRVRVVGRCRST